MKTKRGILLLTGLVLVAFFILEGCKKTEDPGPSQAELDHDTILQYVADHNIDGEFTDGGVFYHIVEPGNDNHPTYSSIVTVSYKGYYLDGTLLQERSFFSEKLFNLIEGWKQGLPLIGEGGKIKLIVPSQLAYNNGILIFDITLHYFSK
ncbi:MAG: peptidylprolyl isomerase [Chlorobi bacterium]|nr:peptidylprolyl isomerase [Chlorobiota bacterium]